MTNSKTFRRVITQAPLAAILVIGAGLATAAPASADDAAVIAPAPLEMARDALYAGDMDSGIALSLEALDTGLSPSEARLAINNLCIGYAVKGATEQAIDYCDRAVGASGDTWKIYNSRARVRFVKRAFEKSLTQ